MLNNEKDLLGKTNKKMLIDKVKVINNIENVNEIINKKACQS